MLRLPEDAPGLERARGRVHYRLAAPPGDGLLRVRVATEFGAGTSAPSEGVVLQPRVDIPRPALAWERLPAGGGTARLYWRRRREAVVQVIGADGRPRPRERFFRANLYRRAAGEAWPLLPVNGEPITAAQWIVPPEGRRVSAGGGAVQFTLRWVDRFGAEGPPAEPVTLPAVPEAQ